MDAFGKGRVQGYGGETPTEWPEELSGAGCAPGNLWKSLFLFPSLNMTKNRRWGRSKDRGAEGVQAAPRIPYAHPLSPADGWSRLALLPPPSLAASATRASQSPDFKTWQGHPSFRLPLLTQRS